MKDTSYLKVTCEDLLWQKIPESLKKKKILYEKQSAWLKVVVYSGILFLDGAETSCVIRELSSVNDFILEEAQNEIDAILITRNLEYFEQYLGIYFENNSTENGILYSYILVKKAYPIVMTNCTIYNQTAKIKWLFEIVKGLFSLSERGYYHGAICPENIFVDEKENVRIGDLFHCGNIEFFTTDFKKLEKKIDLINLDFASPELKLLYNFFKTGVPFKPFNCLKSDIFSFGLTLAYVLTGKIYSFNDIEIDPNLFSNTFINKSPTEVCINETRNSHIFENKIKLYQLQIQILSTIPNIINLNSPLNKILDSTLQVYYDNRCTLNHLIHDFYDLQTFNIENMVESCSSKLFESSEAVEVLRGASDFIRNVRLIEDIEKLSLLVKMNLKKFNEVYRISFKNYFDTFIGQNTRVIDGIIIFFRSLFIQLQNIKDLKKFMNYFKKNTKNINFIQTFSKIVEQDDIITDYVFTGLQIFNLKYDWEFFFCVENRADTFYYIPFKSFPILVEEFKKILTSSSILSRLERFNSSGQNIFNIFFESILPNIFLINTQPSLCGLSSYNRRIFISDFKQLDSISSTLRVRGAIYVTLLHELAHTLRRFKCRTLKDIKNIYTPESNDTFLTYQDDLLPESIRKRGEAGYKLEKELFGNKVIEINDEATELLINYSDMRIPDFRRNFKSLLENDRSQFISIARASEFFTGVKCSMRLMSFD